MTAVTDIRSGLRTALGNVSGFNVVPYMLSAPVVETIHFWPEKVDYDKAGSRGLDLWTWVVQAFVGFTLDVASQARLDDLLNSSGATSLKAVLEADKTLGGAVHDLRVTSADGYQLYTLAGRGDLLLSTWTVDVLAGG